MVQEISFPDAYSARKFLLSQGFKPFAGTFTKPNEWGLIQQRDGKTFAVTGKTADGEIDNLCRAADAELSSVDSLSR